MVKLIHGKERDFPKMPCQVAVGQGRIMSLLTLLLESRDNIKPCSLTHSLTKEK